MTGLHETWRSLLLNYIEIAESIIRDSERSMMKKYNTVICAYQNINDFNSVEQIRKREKNRQSMITMMKNSLQILKEIHKQCSFDTYACNEKSEFMTIKLISDLLSERVDLDVSYFQSIWANVTPVIYETACEIVDDELYREPII